MVKTGNRVGRGAARMVKNGKTGVEEAAEGRSIW
jgi:hypothetical protein